MNDKELDKTLKEIDYSFAKAVVGTNKKDQKLFMDLYKIGLSQESAKESVDRNRWLRSSKRNKIE